MEAHEDAVKQLAAHVKHFYDNNIPSRIYHGSTNSTRVGKKDPAKIVDTSSLNHVISVDEVCLVCVVEPNVAMDALVDELLPYGLIPRVVPEFPGITVGGSYSGTAAESSSFREGYFDRTLNWVEIILADGEVVKASPDQNTDLFYGAAGALGTLGVTTLFEIGLMPASKFVALSYIPTDSINATLQMLDDLKDDASTVFLDAILFASDSGIVLQGRMSASSEASRTVPEVQFSRPQDPWFFLHAHSKLGHKRPSECFVCSLISPSQRGAFWMGAYGWNAIPLSFNQFGRKTLDSMFSTRAMYSIMHHSGQSQRFIVQDLAIPFENGKTFIDFVGKEVRIWPLWLCPIRAGSPVPMHTSKTYTPFDQQVPSCTESQSSLLTLNVGVWGIPYSSSYKPRYFGPKNFSSFIDLNRSIEAKVRELGGLKWLYAHNYSTEAEFWDNYDKEQYEVLRGKWKAKRLPSMWDNIGKTSHEWQKTSIIRGFWKGWLGREYLIQRPEK